MLLHVIIAGIGEGGAVGTCAPHISGPNAAEVCVKDLIACFSVVDVADRGWCGRGAVEFDRKK